MNINDKDVLLKIDGFLELIPLKRIAYCGISEESSIVIKLDNGVTISAKYANKEEAKNVLEEIETHLSTIYVN